MFEVGRTYKVTTKEGDETGYITRTVLEVDMPLVKFSDVGSYIIINTSAPSFFSAEPNDEKSKLARAEEMEKFQARRVGFVGVKPEADF